MTMLPTLKLLHVSQNEHVLLVSVILLEQREKIIGVGGRVNLPHAYCTVYSKHQSTVCDCVTLAIKGILLSLRNRPISIPVLGNNKVPFSQQHI